MSERSITFRIGCSGFYNRHWKKIFYPEKLPQNQWLNFYGEHFNTLELNTTFYRFPTVKSFQTWYGKSPEGFLFAVKAPKIITHLKKFNDRNGLINDLYKVCTEGLGDKLGPVLFQLPPGIQYSPEKLQQVMAGLNPGFKNVIEFRHPSWWVKEVYDELARHRIIFCSVSHPALPANIITDTATAYIRLHGTPHMFYSGYSREALNQLYKTILKANSLKEVFVYFNNTAGTAGILNALHLQQVAV